MRALLLLLTVFAGPAAAAPKPVVVELFTSQGCSSCPPAEAFMRDLAAREGLVALEWHVDYWDDLHAGATGKWKDPFSSPDHTRRQRAYNQALRGVGGGYTPQLVIDGAAETVGSRRQEIERLIGEHPAPAEEPATLAIDGAGEALNVTVKAPAGATVRIVRFARALVTRVEGGENAGKTLAEAHVVRRQEVLGVTGAGAFSATTRAPVAGEGCAVLVEASHGGPVLAAQYCPK